MSPRFCSFLISGIMIAQYAFAVQAELPFKRQEIAFSGEFIVYSAENSGVPMGHYFDPGFAAGNYQLSGKLSQSAVSSLNTSFDELKFTYTPSEFANGGKSQSLTVNAADVADLIVEKIEPKLQNEEGSLYVIDVRLKQVTPSEGPLNVKRVIFTVKTNPDGQISTVASLKIEHSDAEYQWAADSRDKLNTCRVYLTR